ncbi:MAG: hypothetical protein R2724_16970 [Bryobacterales bacterium]
MGLAVAAIAAGNLTGMIEAARTFDGVAADILQPGEIRHLAETLPGSTFRAQLRRCPPSRRSSSAPRSLPVSAYSAGGWRADRCWSRLQWPVRRQALGIARTEAPIKHAIPLEPRAEVADGLRSLRLDWAKMWLSIYEAPTGLSGAFADRIPTYGTQVLAVIEVGVSLRQALAAGIGAGSLLAGRWSGDKAEIFGLVLTGAGAMAFSY